MRRSENDGVHRAVGEHCGVVITERDSLRRREVGSFGYGPSDAGNEPNAVVLLIDSVHETLSPIAQSDDGSADHGVTRKRRPSGPLVRYPRSRTVSYTHLRAHETPEHLVCR